MCDGEYETLYVANDGSFYREEEVRALSGGALPARLVEPVLTTDEWYWGGDGLPHLPYSEKQYLPVRVTRPVVIERLLEAILTGRAR